ncbi:MAG: ABC transporter ATP-binding protein [Alphaproteobacteria bacterium]|nr:ABC transporter ATP-binding protein [Alphaproteobacteria bacterium]
MKDNRQPHTPPLAAELSAAELPADAIVARGLRKVYGSGGSGGSGGSEPALRDVDLTIPRGSFFGLLGPNGAGKSTFINILAGLVIKSAGIVEILGHDIERAARAAASAIGVVPQELNMDAFFTAREILEVQAGLYAVPKAARRTDEILAVMHLSDVADNYPRTLSGGMRRRLLVAKAMVHAPPVLVLDEPTAGVDVELRHNLWTYLRGLNARGTTILLTTHYLEEAEQLCDRIAIIHQGQVVACDTTVALIQRLDRKELTIILGQDLDTVPPPLAAFDAEIRPFRRLVVRYRPSQTPVADILAAVQAADLTILDLSTEESDLEDLFLELTGNGRS